MEGLRLPSYVLGSAGVYTAAEKVGVEISYPDSMRVSTWQAGCGEVTSRNARTQPRPSRAASRVP